MSSVVVYEDSGWLRFLPLTYLRGTFQLLCGMGDLLSRLRRRMSAGELAAAPELWCRDWLAEAVAEQTGLRTNADVPGPALLLNGRGLWHRIPAWRAGEDSWVGVAGREGEVACVAADAALAAKLSAEVMLDDAALARIFEGLPRRDVGGDVTLLTWPWDVVNSNESALLDDWRDRPADQGEIWGSTSEGVHLLARESIYIGAEASIKPSVVIDAEDGPVWIGRNVTILPFTYIQGPACIGDGCLIQPGSVVHAGTTLGTRSKVGGEIEACIIQGYSNKQHDGFLGHSYIGSWVNIAADCINSDLKNTYGNVRVPINGREVDSGELFVGMFVGDHSKAGINVSFPTGAVIGFCSNVFVPRSPKFVPSFCWLDGDEPQAYQVDRAIALANRMMARRGRSLSAAEEGAFLAAREVAAEVERGC